MCEQEEEISKIPEGMTLTLISTVMYPNNPLQALSISCEYLNI